MVAKSRLLRKAVMTVDIAVVKMLRQGSTSSTSIRAILDAHVARRTIPKRLQQREASEPRGPDAFSCLSAICGAVLCLALLKSQRMFLKPCKCLDDVSQFSKHYCTECSFSNPDLRRNLASLTTNSKESQPARGGNEDGRSRTDVPLMRRCARWSMEWFSR